MTRVHPVKKGARISQGFSAKHQAIDYPLPVGTPLYASISGTVTSGSGHKRAGTWVQIKGNDGTVVNYSHLSTRAIKSGKVNAGQIIGKSGNTGNTTGPHLHYSVTLPNGVKVNPEKWLAESAPAKPSKLITISVTLPMLDLSKADKTPVTGEYTGLLQALLLNEGYGPTGLVGKDGKPDNKAGAATKKYLGEHQVKTGTGTGGAADFKVGANTWASFFK